MNNISSFAGMVFGVGLISLFFSIFIVASIPKPENPETPQPYYRLITMYTVGLTVVGIAGAYFLNTLFSFF